jgi:hypothetical protein
VVFGFLKGLGGPEGGYRAIQASYDKHYSLALKQRIEPVSMGLFGALGSRYKLRGKFINDMVHMLEVAPFMMMDEVGRVRLLADYVLADEIPDQIDIQSLRDSINRAVRHPNGESGKTAYELLVSSVPFLVNAPIRWVDWLDEENRESLAEAFQRESNEEQN